MGVAVYIVSEDESLQNDIVMDGKALAEVLVETKLEALAKDNNIEPLTNYVQQTPEQIDIILEDLNLPTTPKLEQKYFSPEKGMKLINEHIKMVLKEEIWIGKERTILVLEDLYQCAKIFKKLIQQNVKWYFAYDF